LLITDGACSLPIAVDPGNRQICDGRGNLDLPSQAHGVAAQKKAH